MLYKQKFTHFFLALVLLVGMIPAGLMPNGVLNGQEAEAAESVKIGDYIHFGKLYGVAILWRVINIDADGNAMLFADRSLTIKAFDSAGDYHKDEMRKFFGSNNYVDSNIRQWLNSSSSNTGKDLINWTQNDPTAANMWSGFNAYHAEKGFLAEGNFTAGEISLLKAISYKNVIAGFDQSIKDDGLTEHSYDTNIVSVLQNYDTSAYAMNVSDKVFLLSAKQLKEYVYDRGWDIRAKPTATATTNSTFKRKGFNNGTFWPYWLSTPNASNSYMVRAVYSDGAIHANFANFDSFGVRPAINIVISNALIAPGGKGTLSEPYKVTGLAPDTQAPTAPIGLQASDITSSSLKLSWTHAKDNYGVTAYEVYRGTTLIGTTTGSTTVLPASFMQVPNLSPNTTYTFTVKAKDAAGNVSNASNPLSVKTLTPVSPTSLNLSASSILENKPENTLVGTLSTVDDDFGDTFTYSLVNGEGSSDNAKFNILNNSLRTSESFDFETKSSYSIRVRVTDSYNLSYEKSFAITVINGNDAPVEIILIGNQVDENIWRGYTVGTLSAIDLDAGDTVTFSLVEGEGDIDNDSFVIVGNKVVTNAELTFVEDEPLLIRVKATDSSGLSYSQAFEIEVTQSNTQLNDDFKVLTVFFQENIVNNQGDLDALKSKLQLVSNAAAVSPVTPTYTALKADDKVKVNKDGTMTVTFAQPLSINTYRLKIDKDALKDSYNNKSADLITSPFVVDGTGPQIVSVKVAKNKKTITVKFNKRKIAMATAGVKPADVAASFKKAITLTKNSNVATPTYSPLGAKDTVNVSGNNVIITISEGVPPGPNNKLRFSANALKDMGGYKSAVLHTKVELDSVGPLVNKILVEAKNKKITIIFKEKIIQSTAGNGDEKKAALRNAIKLNKTAIINTTNYVPLMADDVILYQQPDRIIITLKNALTGSQNRFRIAQGILKDEFGNLSPNIETSNIVADEVGPALVTSPKVSVNVRVNSGNKIIQVHFNERMYNGSLKASSAEKLADLTKAIQYTLDADVANPIYKSLLTSEKVLIKSKRLEINLSNALPAAKNLKLKISAGAVADLAGNLNLAITTGSFTVDTTGPKLR